MHCLLPSLGAWWEAAGFVWVPWAEGLWGYAVPPGKVECTVGNKALLTLGLFPGQGSFRERWYRQQSEGEKNNLSRGKQKEPPKKTTDEFGTNLFYLQLHKALKVKSVFETPGVNNKGAFQTVYLHSALCYVLIVTAAFTAEGPILQ